MLPSPKNRLPFRAMRDRRITVLGIGSLQSGPAIVGAFATYFGERPIEVAFYDPDPERLELLVRFANTAFSANKAGHLLLAFEDPGEAVESADQVIIALDKSGAARLLGIAQSRVTDKHLSSAVAELVGMIPDAAKVLAIVPHKISIPGRVDRRTEPPTELDAESRRALPHQLLRWIRGEEYLFEFFAEHESSRLRDWLDDPVSARLSS